VQRRSILFAVAVALGVTGETQTAKADEQFFPILTYRTGPYAPSGIPLAHGFLDYYKLVNKRDGGINGVRVTFEECEFKYKTNIGVECYEKLKHKGQKGASMFNPLSTGMTYQIIPKARVDKIPILSMGYGRTSTADGRVFPWVFNFPATYWSQASATIRYIANQEGGLKNLKGMKIAHVYHNSAYGKEANPTLRILAKKFGFNLIELAVDSPGQEQKATWIQVRRKKPRWVFMSGWGVMNQVAIKEAANIRFPMDRFIGNWWSGSDADVIPAGKGAVGYKSSAMHGAGDRWQVHKDIVKYVYNGDAAKAKKNKLGEVLYNRAILNAMFSIEAVRAAQKKFGVKTMSGTEVRWGLENLRLTKENLTALGMKGFAQPVAPTCADHAPGGGIAIQQWDGKAWNVISDWVPPFSDIVRPLIEKAAATYALEAKITPRSCG
jgi:branched-chain amino acid transport system substrate-binding protein